MEGRGRILWKTRILCKWLLLSRSNTSAPLIGKSALPSYTLLICYFIIRIAHSLGNKQKVKLRCFVILYAASLSKRLVKATSVMHQSQELARY